MPEPIVTNIPHQLGREEARRRIDDGIGDIVDAIPGGVLHEHRWEGDVMHFTVGAMGQRLACELDVREAVVTATIALPAFLGPFAGAIRQQIEKQAPKLLEKK